MFALFFGDFYSTFLNEIQLQHGSALIRSACYGNPFCQFYVIRMFDYISYLMYTTNGETKRSNRCICLNDMKITCLCFIVSLLIDLFIYRFMLLHLLCRITLCSFHSFFIRLFPRFQELKLSHRKGYDIV